MKTQIKVGIGSPDDTAGEFIEKWKNAESGDMMETEYRLYFENLETLLKTLTPSRWELLKTLRINGPMTEDSLAGRLGMNCSSIHRETKELETAGLISRRAEDLLEVSWDTIEAHLRLAA